MAFYSSLLDKSPQIPEIPLSIFIRLEGSPKSKFNGKDILDIYEKFCNENKSVWFTTDSLSTAMDKSKKKDFLKAIHDGYIVEIFFATGPDSGGKNEIEYKATVIDVKTDKVAMPSPDKSLTPNEGGNVKNKIWIQIKDLTPCTDFTANDFIIASTGNILAAAIANPQFHFGYIKKK